MKLRIRSMLDETWVPPAKDSIGDYLILSPLAQATFECLLTSEVNMTNKMIFLCQLLEGIAFLHDNGIWHRDIKPANILIDHYHPPKCQITDFGCASTEEPILYDFPGTIAYLAPEQQEKKYHGREVDYWACGLVCLQLLGGPAPKTQILPGH